MPDALFLIRFGEIGIKSPPVRRRFARLLGENILRGVRARGGQGRLEATWGRLFLEAEPRTGRDALAHTFGVVSFSPVQPAPATLPELAGFAAREARAIPDAASIAVRARRSGATGFSSMDAARALGTSILAEHGARGLTVDLDHPDVEVVVEVRDARAWVGFENLPGPGGLPVASEGRVSAWVDGPRGALAAWMVMKRGCRADLLAPEGQGEALAKALAAWDPGIELTEVAAPEDRATLLALLARHARQHGGGAVVLGDGFAQAMALAPLDRSVALAVFRPLVALDAALRRGAAGLLGVEAPDEDAPPPAGSAEGASERADALLRDAPRRKVGL